MFSERKGLVEPRKAMQIDSMDMRLRVRLWEVLNWAYLRWLDDPDSEMYIRAEQILYRLHIDFFGHGFSDWYSDPPDTGELSDFVFGAKWFEVYDILEFIVQKEADHELNNIISHEINLALEDERSAYRMVGHKIIELSSEHEVVEIERTIQTIQGNETVSSHITRALELMSDRKSPDYRNSIKESISAVEALCNQITQERKSLGEALKAMEKKGLITLHPALYKSYLNLYGYTSDADGIRHALSDAPSLDIEDARFVFISCSSFINYLLSKCLKNGIEIDNCYERI